MSAALFRSFGAFGAKGKVVLISVVTLLFSFFLIIPSEFLLSFTPIYPSAHTCIPLLTLST